jgi:hypothetical protein
MSGKITLYGIIAILTLWIAGTFPVIAIMLFGLGIIFLFLVFGKD